jgi:hypothetical protein
MNAGFALNVTGHVRSAGMLSWARVVIAIPCILAGFRLNGALGVAQAILLADILFTPGMYYEVMKAIPLTTRDMIGIVWRPLAASAVMAALLCSHPFSHVGPVALRLFLEVGSKVASPSLYVLAGFQ